MPVRKTVVRALDGVDLEIPEGTILGLLGPNGAGKTTTVRILATLLKPDAGHATVAGFDVVRQAQQLRRVIGLSGQYAAVDENLTGRENLVMFGRLYQLPKIEAQKRADELLEPRLQPFAEWNPISTLTTSLRTLWGNLTPFPGTSLASTQPILITLVWFAVILGVFAPLGVRRYSSMSR